MLITLRIKNLALVDDLTLELGEGYTAITGETGAGKSIIIGALKLVLGERADRTLLRAGCDACTVEAVFDIARVRLPVSDFLEQNGLETCEDHQLVIRRAFTASGSNRQFINGSPTTLACLAGLGEWLVDIHGPHDHQSLLQPARQLDILDAYAGVDSERELFGRLLGERTRALAARADLILDDHTHAQQLDLLRFQVGEIEAAGLQPGEEERIASEHQRAGNAARLLEVGHAAVNQLSEGEASMLDQAAQVTRLLQELGRLDDAALPFLRQHEQTIEGLNELAVGVSRYLDTIDLDPARFNELEERLGIVQSLKRKYGSSIQEILSFGDQARTRLHALEQRDEELARLEQNLRKIESDLCKAGRNLSDGRRKVIARLSDAVNRELAALGFASGRLDIALRSQRPSPGPTFGQPSNSGFDSVEFQFSPNPGEPARPLRAIASSGELARVMLALKTVLAAQDAVPVLVFDEVDANVGGETARAVGEKMRQIASQRQVLCITHLPQVAAPASHHLRVTKRTVGDRTVSALTAIDGRERVEELSRMLGGGGAAAEQHAKAILAGQP